MDDEIEASTAAKKKEILDSLRNCLKSVNPVLLQRLDNKQAETQAQETSEERTEAIDNSGTAEINSSDFPLISPDPGLLRIAEEKRKLEEDMNCLKSRGIEIVNKDWETYISSHWR